MAEPGGEGSAEAGRRARVHAWWRRLERSERFEWIAWIAGPLAGMVWIASWYRNNWYHFDEWSMIERSLDGVLQGMLAGHQGHLTVTSFLVYNVQRSVLGLEGHHLTWLAHIVAIGALHVSLVLLLRRLGLSMLFALLVATIATYFGPGGQDVVWQFQWSITLAFALSFFAAWVALGTQRRTRDIALVGALLVAAAMANSGIAVLGLVYVGIVLAISWPWRATLRALVPATVLHAAWIAFGDGTESIGTTFGKMFSFAAELVLYAAGGLLGGGETRTKLEAIPTDAVIPLDVKVLGGIALVAALAIIGITISRRGMTRSVTASFVGGIVAALLCAGSLARTRAFLTNPDEFPGLRYVQWVALFLAVAFAPALATTLRPRCGASLGSSRCSPDRWSPCWSSTCSSSSRYAASTSSSASRRTPMSVGP